MADKNVNIGTDLTVTQTDIIEPDEVLDGQVVVEDTGLKVETWDDSLSETKNIRVAVTEQWLADVPSEWLDELDAIRDALFELASRLPPAGL